MINTAVFGCGHPDRGDDAVGILVVRALRTRLSSEITLHEVGDDPLLMLTLWPGVQRAIAIDAAVTGAAAGTVHRFASPDLDFVQERFATSSHGISLREVIQLARTIGRLPGQLIIFAIEGVHFRAGAPITPEVQDAIGQVVDIVMREVSVA